MQLKAWESLCNIWKTWKKTWRTEREQNRKSEWYSCKGSRWEGGKFWENVGKSKEGVRWKEC